MARAYMKGVVLSVSSFAIILPANLRLIVAACVIALLAYGSALAVPPLAFSGAGWPVVVGALGGSLGGG